MARASYIWIVGVPEDGHVYWAGTVKHELITWLQKHKSWNIEDWKVLRAPDGREFEDRDVPIMSAAKFLEING